MTNGPVHEVGETARSVIDIFRAQPYMLAMTIVNLALLGFLYYDGVTNNQQRRRELELLYENRKYVGQLLAECIPAKVVPNVTH